jgi:hypothetical protein
LSIVIGPVEVWGSGGTTGAAFWTAAVETISTPPSRFGIALSVGAAFAGNTASAPTATASKTHAGKYVPLPSRFIPQR